MLDQERGHVLEGAGPGVFRSKDRVLRERSGKEIVRSKCRVTVCGKA